MFELLTFKNNKLSSRVIAIAMLIGCASMLPTSKVEVQTPRRNYADAQALYEKIVANKSTAVDLKVLGLDADSTSNVVSLSNADLMRRFASAPGMEIDMLDQHLRGCLRKLDKCIAMEIEQMHTQRDRIGNFWMDFLNFHHETLITGWKFDASIVFDDGLVDYKVWSGKPNIRELEDSRNPLGPFQGMGEATLHRAI